MPKKQTNNMMGDRASAAMVNDEYRRYTYSGWINFEAAAISEDNPRHDTGWKMHIPVRTQEGQEELAQLAARHKLERIKFAQHIDDFAKPEEVGEKQLGKTAVFYHCEKGTDGRRIDWQAVANEAEAIVRKHGGPIAELDEMHIKGSSIGYRNDLSLKGGYLPRYDATAYAHDHDLPSGLKHNVLNLPDPFKDIVVDLDTRKSRQSIPMMTAIGGGGLATGVVIGSMIGGGRSEPVKAGAEGKAAAIVRKADLPTIPGVRISKPAGGATISQMAANLVRQLDAMVADAGLDPAVLADDRTTAGKLKKALARVDMLSGEGKYQEAYNVLTASQQLASAQVPILRDFDIGFSMQSAGGEGYIAQCGKPEFLQSLSRLQHDILPLQEAMLTEIDRRSAARGR